MGCISFVQEAEHITASLCARQQQSNALCSCDCLSTMSMSCKTVWQCADDKFIKSVATCPTDQALQGALQLPREDVINSATAPAAGISPCLSSLCTHQALPFQLLVERWSCNPVHLILQSSNAAQELLSVMLYANLPFLVVPSTGLHEPKKPQPEFVGVICL